MQRSVKVAIVATAVALGTAVATGNVAASTNNSSGITQTVAPGHHASANSSKNSTQLIGDAEDYDDSGALNLASGIFQEIGTFGTSSGNTGSVNNSSNANQVIGGAEVQSEFGGTITGSSSDDSATINNFTGPASPFPGNGGSCGSDLGHWCGQFIGAGSWDNLAMNGSLDNQEIFFFGSGTGANHNTLNEKGNDDTEWVTNADGVTAPTKVISPTNDALGTSLFFPPSVGTNASDNTLSENGNGDTAVVANGSNDDITIDGSNDTVFLEGVNGEDITIVGNNIICTDTGSGLSAGC